MNNLIRSRGKNGLLAGPEAFSRGKGGPPSHHFPPRRARVSAASELSDGGREHPTCPTKAWEEKSDPFSPRGVDPQSQNQEAHRPPQPRINIAAAGCIHAGRAKAMEGRDKESRTEERGKRQDVLRGVDGDLKAVWPTAGFPGRDVGEEKTA